jgi:hypothetical protein
MKYAIVAIAAMAAFFVGGSLPLVWFAANLNSARLAVEARSPLQLEEIEPANLQAVRRPSMDPADTAGLLNGGRELVAAGNIPAAQRGGPAGQPQKLKQEGVSGPLVAMFEKEQFTLADEKPVDPGDDPTRDPNGGPVSPLSGGFGVGPYPSALAAGAPRSVALTEPKQVKTVTIQVDPATPAAAYRVVPRAVVPGPAPRASERVAPSQSAAPLALTSQSSVAAVNTASPAAPARATPRTGESGMWVVQLSAEKTEAEAQSAFRVTQTKYSVLGSYQPLIRKKDQGERGVFYAAQVGPLARDEANQLCETLKSAGASCYIQRN